MLLQARSYKPGAPTITLIDSSGADTGYKLLGEPDWGNAVWDLIFSGTRGTRGARAVGGRLPNRTPSFSLRVYGSSKDDLATRLSTLKQLGSGWRRFGGQLIWRSKNQSYRQIFEVLAGDVAVNPWQARAEHSNRQDVTIGFNAEPYLQGDPFDLLDDFSVDSLADYTFQAGNGDLAAGGAGGQLTVTANVDVQKRLVHTARGYTFGDHEATLKVIPGAVITNLLAGVMLKWQLSAPDQYLLVYVDDNGTNSRLRIDRVLNGVATNVASTNLGNRMANGSPLWVRGRIDGMNVYAEMFLKEPSPMMAPDSATSYLMTVANDTSFFPGSTEGKAGIAWTPKHMGATLDDFAVRPFTYRNVSWPEQQRFYGAVPGDAPAIFDAYITPSGGAAAAIWAALGWWPALDTWNRCWNGDFEVESTAGWSNAAVTNITSGATSIGLSTAFSKYGSQSGQIVCPATANSGVSFRVFRSFKKGVTYTAWAWIHSAAGTTNTYIRLGNGAANDKASSSNTALSPSWQLISVSWVPTADYDNAHVAINIAAATGTTFEIDGVTVTEGQNLPTNANQSEGRGGFPPLGLIEAENDVNAAPTSNASMRSGFGNSVGATVSVVIDPSLLVSEDFSQSEIAVEVWARVEYVAATVPTLYCYARPLSAANLPNIYTEELGAAGRALTPPSAGTVRRMTRLGILRLPTTAGRYFLVIGAVAGLATIDYMLLLPAAARILSPTGRANNSTFPQFAGLTSELTRRIRADQSGTIKEPGTAMPESLAPGLGGTMLEAPPGQMEGLLKLSSLVPDDPSSNADTEQLAHSATLHLAVTPRYEEARPS